MDKTIIRGVFFSAMGGIGWGISGVCSQYLFALYDLDSAWLTALRMVLSGILLLGLAYLQNKNQIFRIMGCKKDRRQLVLFAVAGLLLCQYAFLTAIRFANSGTATVLQSLNVVILIIFLSLKTKTLPDKIQLLSIWLAITGVFLIATNGNPKMLVISPAGLFWGIMAAVGVVSYALLSKSLTSTWGNTMITGWGMLIGGLCLSPFARILTYPEHMDFKAILALAVIILVGTAGAFAFFLEGVKSIGPVKATLIACLEPLTATLFSALWLGTRFSLMDLIGFSFIILTIVLSTLPSKATRLQTD